MCNIRDARLISYTLFRVKKKNRAVNLLCLVVVVTVDKCFSSLNITFFVHTLY